MQVVRPDVQHSLACATTRAKNRIPDFGVFTIPNSTCMLPSLSTTLRLMLKARNSTYKDILF